MGTDERCARLLLEVMYPLYRRLESHSKRMESDGEITLSQLFALKLIANGAAQPTELARSMNVSLPAATNMLDTLVGRELVSRSRGESDRRAVYLDITEKGRSAMREHGAKLVESVSELVHPMPAAKQQSLAEGLESLRTLFAEIADERELVETR